MTTTPKPAPRIAALMTVHNRRDATVRCLESLESMRNDDVVVFVVDDASTDGTPELVAERFPHVRLIAGDGDLYWNGGMKLAMDSAMRDGFDFYWWLNDDVVLDQDALDRLLETARAWEGGHTDPAIVVGSMRDPTTAGTTYGGVVAGDRWRPLKFSLVPPGEEIRMAHTMNGNCVLIPGAVVERLGSLSPEYRQGMGDYDYGLRARNAGFEVIVAPGTHGTCPRNPLAEPTGAPLHEDLKRMWSVKELPVGSWLTFSRRWGGPLWPLYFVSPYVRGAFRLIVGRFRRR